MAIRIGCGSWTDDAYVGVLYPKDLPPADRLRGYATHFSRVEVNATYYATPKRETVAAWVAQTPAGFRFDVKLHRGIAQNPQKAPDGELVGRMLEALQPMIRAGKLGSFLLTLPPGFGPERHDLAELDALARSLAPHPLAVELRDRAWVTDDRRASTLEHYRQHRLVWVALDLPRIDAPSILPAIDEVTNASLAYMRLHGRNRDYAKAKTAAERHHHAYRSVELEEIASRIRHLATLAADVHVSANNHAEDFAPKAALDLQELVQRSR